MADDNIAQKRAAVAETRARIDRNLDELTGHVPAKDDVTQVAVKYGAALGGVLAAVGVVVVVTKSKLAARRDRKTGETYAKALVAAFPEVAEAYRNRIIEQPVIEQTVVEEVVAAPGEAGPRGGAPTALLTGLGVVAGVAISQKIAQKG